MKTKNGLSKTLALLIVCGSVTLGNPPGIDMSAGQAPSPGTKAESNAHLQAAATAAKAGASAYFYIYMDKGSQQNHFAASGWMGDVGDLQIDEASRDNPKEGRTCMKVTYSAKGTQGANWAGIFWQEPVNNWGDKSGGYDLSHFKKLTFWARGAKGGEKINEFKVGGITGENGDSDSSSIGPVSLTPDWKQYTIDLSNKNLGHIVGGFAWSTSRDSNPQGATFYLDQIRFES
jgi:hypothetical protein